MVNHRGWWTTGDGGPQGIETEEWMGGVIGNSYRGMEAKGWTLGVDAEWTQAKRCIAWMKGIDARR